MFGWSKPVQEEQTILDFTKAETMGCHWHQVDYMQVICTSLHRGYESLHTTTLSLIFRGQMLFLLPKFPNTSVKALKAITMPP